MQPDGIIIREARKQFQDLIPTEGQTRQRYVFVQECKLLFQYTWQQQDRHDLLIHTPVSVLSDLAHHAAYSAGRLFIASVLNEKQGAGTETIEVSPTAAAIESIVVLKVFKCEDWLDRVSHALHEILMGVFVVNPLRSQLPTFVATRGWSHTRLLRPVTTTRRDCQDACRKIQSTSPHSWMILIEPVLPSLTLQHWLLSGRATPLHVSNMYLHILGSLKTAHDQFGFIHQDSNLANILVQTIEQFHQNSNLAACTRVSRLFNEWVVDYGDSLVFPLIQFIPRIIDYGLSSATVKDIDVSYVYVLHEEMETCHFLGDVSKLIGFPLWNLRASEDPNSRLSDLTTHTNWNPTLHTSCVKSFCIKLGLDLINYLKHRWNYIHYYNSKEEPCEQKTALGLILESFSPSFSSYCDYILCQWIYRIVYPLPPFDLTSFKSLNRSSITIPPSSIERRSLNTPLFALDNIDFWSDLLYAMALFEYVCSDVRLESERKILPSSTASYIPRDFNPMKLVNFYYLPNLTILADMEEIYIKARMDAQALISLPRLAGYVRFIAEKNLFNAFREQIFDIVSVNDYFNIVERNITMLRAILPTYQVLFKNVILPSSLFQFP